MERKADGGDADELLKPDSCDDRSPPLSGSQADTDGLDKEIVSTLLLGAGFFFTFTAWHSAQNLQSSLHFPSGVSGTTSLDIVYSLLPVGYLFGPPIVRIVGLKRTIAVAMAMYGTFIGANIYPRWWTIYPAACLVGLACGPLFVAQNTLLTEYALSYARKKGLEETSKVGMFQGIFQGCFMFTQAVGNTFYACLFHSKGSGDDPAHSTIVLLFSIYSGCVVLGIIIIVVGLPDATAELVPDRSVISALKLLKQSKMYSLLPFLLSSGLMYSFITDDFTKNIVKKSLGEDNLGFVMAMNGLASALTNVLCSRFSDVRGAKSRLAVFLCGIFLNAAVSTFLYFWSPSSGDWLPICIVAVVMGLSTASCTTMLNAHLSANWVGETDSAFGGSSALLGVAQATGFFVAGSLPMRTMLLLAVPSLIIGGVGFCYSVTTCQSKRPIGSLIQT